jgi:hypothetical protein
MNSFFIVNDITGRLIGIFHKEKTADIFVKQNPLSYKQQIATDLRIESWIEIKEKS